VKTRAVVIGIPFLFPCAFSCAFSRSPARSIFSGITSFPFLGGVPCILAHVFLLIRQKHSYEFCLVVLLVGSGCVLVPLCFLVYVQSVRVLRYSFLQQPQGPFLFREAKVWW
jgi:predicted membrane protein